MDISEFRHLSFDAQPLLYRRVSPDGPTAASLLIVHGMGEHGGRYLDTARALAGAGIECLIPDLRGFGRSSGRRGDVRRIEDHIRDLEGLFHLLGRAAPERPVFILGHSYGGFLACRLALLPEIKAQGLVLTSPLVEPAIRIPGWKNVLSAVAARVCPIYSERIPLDPRLLTHDVRVLQRDADDPYLHYRMTARFYQALRHALAEFPETAPRLRCPILILQAGEDHVVSRSATERYFQNIASADKELESLPGLYHEILNETSRSRLTSKIAEWVIKRSNR